MVAENSESTSERMFSEELLTRTRQKHVMYERCETKAKRANYESCGNHAKNENRVKHENRVRNGNYATNANCAAQSSCSRRSETVSVRASQGSAWAASWQSFRE